MNKYRITDEQTIFNDRVLRRIQAIQNFGNIKEGDLGGWVQGEWNLSQEGECWIWKNGMVFDKAKVRGNAKILDRGIVMNSAIVEDNAYVYANAKVAGNAIVSGNAKIYECAWVDENVRVCENAHVWGQVWDQAVVYGSARIYEEAGIWGNACVGGDVEVNNIILTEKINLKGRAKIMNKGDIKIFNWHPQYPLAITKNPKPLFHCGEFTGTQEEFLKFIGIDLAIS